MSSSVGFEGNSYDTKYSGKRQINVG